MNPIDSVLGLLVQQGGTELRLASGRAPRMFSGDVELPLTMPPMSAVQIRGLLAELWTAHEAELCARGSLEVAYRSREVGTYAVRFQRVDDDTLDIRFRHQVDVDPGHGIGRDDASGVDTAPLPAALRALLERAAARGASDLHLSPGRAPVVRVNGMLHVLDGEAPVDPAVLLDRPGDAEIIGAGRSVDRAGDAPGVGRVRVNVYASDEGLCAAIRVLRREAPTLAELNLPGQLEALIDLPHGLVITCGPTGSGKSTTLAALLQHGLRVRQQVLITLEDPIEYVIRPKGAPGLVRQREVRTHVRDFATGLRDALREDPDVLLIGEMRDAETIGLALTAAETGHLVFATLHSRTAASAVERIVDTYPPQRQRQIRVQLADALRAIVSQRLLPTSDGSGRVPALEILRVTYAVANLIREGRTAQIVNALQGGGDDGMLVLERHLAELVRTNRIRRDTALAAANDTATLAEYLRG